MGTRQPKVVSIQVGLPRKIGLDDSQNLLDAPFMTGFLKLPIDGPVMCRKLNLDGDGQADLVHHGGVDKAVLFYDSSHYPDWCAQFQTPYLPFGGFGENFTVTSQSECTVCIGDIYEIGGAILEISQPRRPCWKLERRWQRPGLLQQVEEKGWTGWYGRVLQEGFVSSGDEIRLVQRPLPEFTVEYVTRVVQQRHSRIDEARQLANCGVLSENIRMTLIKAIDKHNNQMA